MQKQHPNEREAHNRGGTIADRIKAKRKTAGLSQSQAAEAWKISKRTLQQWEQGARRPHGLYLAHIEKILKG